MTTQRDRVLRLLEARGKAGVSTTDLLDPPDGGDPILRVAARIEELRDAGYVIRTERLLDRTARYVLTDGVPVGRRPVEREPPAVILPRVTRPEPVFPSEQAALFDAKPKPRNAIYGEAW